MALCAYKKCLRLPATFVALDDVQGVFFLYPKSVECFLQLVRQLSEGIDAWTRSVDQTGTPFRPVRRPTDLELTDCC